MIAERLSGLVVLLVEDDPDSRELLAYYLESVGCRLRVAGDATGARAHLVDWRPDVILSDVTLPGEDGFSLLASLRASPATRGIPAVAMTGRSDAASRERAAASGFQKFVTKPIDLFSLPAALASVASSGVAGDEERAITRRDLRALLASLNQPTPYRYTSVLRVDDDRLESVWTFDRARPDTDTFPPDAALCASYCALVVRERAAVSIEDALADPRAADHPKREALRAYCGVPLFRRDGTLFGTLCHYDERPQPVDPATLAALSQLAARLTCELPPAWATPPATRSPGG